jgi:hypothetical protein
MAKKRGENNVCNYVVGKEVMKKVLTAMLLEKRMKKWRATMWFRKGGMKEGKKVWQEDVNEEGDSEGSWIK